MQFCIPRVMFDVRYLSWKKQLKGSKKYLSDYSNWRPAAGQFADATLFCTFRNNPSILYHSTLTSDLIVQFHFDSDVSNSKFINLEHRVSDRTTCVWSVVDRKSISSYLSTDSQNNHFVVTILRNLFTGTIKLR